MFKVNRISPHLADVVFSQECCRNLGFRPKPGAVSVLSGYGDRPREFRGVAPFVASFQIGLKSGFGIEETFDPIEIQKSIMERFPQGGSMVLQLGWFEGSREDSVRVTVENDLAASSNEDFSGRIVEMLGAFVDKYRQKAIWFDLYQGNVRIDSREIFWVADEH